MGIDLSSTLHPTHRSRLRVRTKESLNSSELGTRPSDGVGEFRMHHCSTSSLRGRVSSKESQVEMSLSVLLTVFGQDTIAVITETGFIRGYLFSPITASTTRSPQLHSRWTRPEPRQPPIR